MTPDAFRRAALALPGTVESAHMNHPDFRVGNKVFATLGYPDRSWGMVKLPQEEQQRLIESLPETFTPAAGAWGRQGSTLVRLAKAKPQETTYALEMAWRLAQTKAARKKSAKV